MVNCRKCAIYCFLLPPTFQPTEESSCRTHGLLKPVRVQVGHRFQLKCPLCSEQSSLARYVWYKDGQVVPGEERRVLQITSAAAQHGGKYHCRVAGRTDFSTVVHVTVQGKGKPLVQPLRLIGTNCSSVNTVCT